MSFRQRPPELANPYQSDALLRGYLARRFAPGALDDELRDAGEWAVRYHARLAQERLDEPVLTGWDAWGNRVDDIELTPLWRDFSRLACEKGLIATAYERRHGAQSRLHQFALVYLLEPSSGVYSCPLAMTDGAARTLLASGNRALIERAVSRLTTRDFAQAWTSGQWMTERTGGSDVGLTETTARPDAGEPGVFRLFGTKWFTSATTAQMTLTLARPEGNPAKGSGLALFYLELRDARGQLNGIRIHRLKEKLGTRMVPTAELELDGARAVPVMGLSDGIRNIAPMLTTTRTWNAVAAAALMRRGLQLARDYAGKRVAFGAPLAKKPLHLDTLASLEAECAGAFLLSFRAAELLGLEDTQALTEAQARLFRVLTPLAKLTTGKQVVQVTSEVLEAFGGAGYVEDTGLPRLLRDAQVLPIWEGTTNVLSLDVLRALTKDAGALDGVVAEVERCTQGAHAQVAAAAEVARWAVAHARAWFQGQKDGAAVEAGARRFALTLGRALELAYLVEHASWALGQAGDERPAALARWFAASAVDLIVEADLRADAERLG